MTEKMLIIAATDLEIQPFLKHHGLKAQKFTEHPAFDLLISGVGSSATSFALGKYAQKNHQFILNVGIAGSFDKSIKLGDVVNISSDCFADFGAESPESFLSAESLGLGKNKYASTVSFNSTQPNIYTELNKLKKVTAITVQTVHGTTEGINRIQNLFPVQVESMEGAAVFYAAQELGLPAIQVRSISNYVEPRNRANWEIQKAVQNLNNWLIEFVASTNEL